MLFLDMSYDDGFIAYLNGVEVARRNAPADAVWNSEATAAHPDSEAVEFERIDISEHAGLLEPGTNLLAVHGLNVTEGSNDMLVLPELAVSRTTGREPVRLEETTVVRARVRSGDAWSALVDVVLAVDAGLRITEILYHPAADPREEWDENEFEFVELQNTGSRAIDLRGYRLVRGVEFDFAAGHVTTLAPGESAVVVGNALAFAARYGVDGIRVAGEYTGKLANDGEDLELAGPLGTTVQRFAYYDAWHPSTDGGGASLVIRDVRGGRESWWQGASWRPSRFALGSPGVDESEAGVDGGRQRPGDANNDGALDISDPVRTLLGLFGGAGGALPCGDGTFGDPANVALLDVDGDRAVDLSDAIHLLAYIIGGGPPPALGVACVRIDGCPDACAQ
jgi:hypothetical protein